MNARPRIAAVGALVFGALGFVLAAVIVIDAFPRGLIAAALVIAATIGAWYLIVGPLSLRVFGGAATGVEVAISVLLTSSDHQI